MCNGIAIYIIFSTGAAPEMRKIRSATRGRPRAGTSNNLTRLPGRHVPPDPLETREIREENSDIDHTLSHLLSGDECVTVSL